MLANIFKISCCCLILAGCSGDGGNYSSIDSLAARHKAKLRQHFMGERVGDISTLISETRAISSNLKRAGRVAQANKFDSYTDVLMYGNRTLDESMKDVIELTGNGWRNFSGMDGDDCDKVFFIRWYRSLTREKCR
ncbi:MAG: hypothetical protein LBJ71_04580 [Holosporaceae bacterium]|nr:hypothetical protein [Holosporaceae bacterium]